MIILLFIFVHVFTFSRKLYIFVWLWVTVWCLFVWTWRTPFSISCREGLVVMNYLSFCLSRNVLISPSFLKDNFARYRIMCWQFFSHSTLFLAELGLCCCTQAFSSCGEWGLLFVVVRGFLITVASPVAEHGL